MPFNPTTGERSFKDEGGVMRLKAAPNGRRATESDLVELPPRGNMSGRPSGSRYVTDHEISLVLDSNNPNAALLIPAKSITPAMKKAVEGKDVKLVTRTVDGTRLIYLVKSN